MNASVQSFEEFAAAHGLVGDYEVSAHVHAGLRSAPQTKTWQRWYHAEALRLHVGCLRAHEAYEAAIAAGEVMAPPRPSLDRIAAGHPDNPSVQAARRALERRQAVKAELSGDSGQLPEPALAAGVALMAWRVGR